MAAVTTSPAALDDEADGIDRRRIAIGVVEIAIAALIFWAFGLGSEAGTSATFVLTSGGVDAPDVSVPVRTSAYLLAFGCALIGGIQLGRGFGKRSNAALGVVAAMFVLSLLAWAAAGTQFNFTGMVQITLSRATPLALGALAGLLCERSGVVNIAIEGMMLAAAFVGSLVASAASNLYLGIGGAVLMGALLGSLLAVLSIRYRVDQIVGGTVINIFAAGMTGYLYSQIFARYPQLNDAGTLRPVDIPGLSQIPVIGPALFQASPFVYVMIGLTALISWALARTRWGLRVRAIGEHPKAADTIGIDVRRMRFWSVVLGGMCAGLAGAFLSLGSLGHFERDMTAGRGFIALAALIFGRWRAWGAFWAAILFGFAEALQVRLSSLSTPIPSDLLLASPYLLTLIAVAGLVGKSRAPAADGQPY